MKTRRSIGELRRALDSASADERETACEELAEMGELSVVSKLIELLDDPEEAVRYDAENALMNLCWVKPYIDDDRRAWWERWWETRSDKTRTMLFAERLACTVLYHAAGTNKDPDGIWDGGLVLRMVLDIDAPYVGSGNERDVRAVARAIVNLAIAPARVSGKQIQDRREELLGRVSHWIHGMISRFRKVHDRVPWPLDEGQSHEPCGRPGSAP